GVYFPMNSQSGTGDVSLPLGVKGILVAEFEARGGPHGGPKNAEIHSSLKAIVDSPVWRLTHALASLTSPDGNTILVPGYYDAIRQPTEAEQRLANAAVGTPETNARLRQGLGIDRFARDAAGRDLISDLLFTTTININGIWSGYTGEGMKTILPHVARARIDSRLVPNQTPDEQLALIRKHLDAQGFSDVTVRKISGYAPAQTDPDDPIVSASIAVFNK